MLSHCQELGLYCLFISDHDVRVQLHDPSHHLLHLLLWSLHFLKFSSLVICLQFKESKNEYIFGPGEILQRFLFFDLCFHFATMLLRASLVASGKESTCNAGASGLMLGQKIPWRWAWQPTPVFLPGESHGQRSQVCKRVGHDWSEWAGAMCF